MSVEAGGSHQAGKFQIPIVSFLSLIKSLRHARKMAQVGAPCFMQCGAEGVAKTKGTSAALRGIFRCPFSVVLVFLFVLFVTSRPFSVWRPPFSETPTMRVQNVMGPGL